MVDNPRPGMQIKGIREVLLVTLGEGPWNELQIMLLKNIEEQFNFFRGARLALDVGNQILHAVALSSLRDLLSEHQVSLWAVISNSPTTEKTAQVLGLATRLNVARPDRTIRYLDTDRLTGESAILVQRTLRSGFKLSFQGHIVVIGDVNPRAEIITSGIVIVWGRLRGVVHAGAEGSEKAIVCALDMAPTQLRIAVNIAIPPQRKGKPQPEIAAVQNGQVIVEPWYPREK